MAKKRQKASWELCKPRLHETASRSLVTRRQEVGFKDKKKIRRLLKLSSRRYETELDHLLPEYAVRYNASWSGLLRQVH
jgi:hypothetical protein